MLSLELTGLIAKKLEKNKMITFFNLGPNNDWKNILDKDFANKLSVIFKEGLNEFNY